MEGTHWRSKRADTRLGLGKHLMIDAYGVDREKLRDSQRAKNLLNNLPKKIKMRPLGKAVVKKITSPLYPNWGISGFVILYESHISLHTWPEKSYLAMDIYSCKNFNEKRVISYLKKYWGTKEIRIVVVERG